MELLDFNLAALVSLITKWDTTFLRLLMTFFFGLPITIGRPKKKVIKWLITQTVAHHTDGTSLVCWMSVILAYVLNLAFCTSSLFSSLSHASSFFLCIL